MTPNPITDIERPDPSLMSLYLIRAILTGPLVVVVLPFLYFRYHTMRYRFDDEGIHQRWGILFRREINLTYARIQDIHLTSGVIQRWLGLADIKIQTASGSAGAEMTIEGLRCFEAARDFLYSKMRGMRHDQGTARPLAPSAESRPPTPSTAYVQVLADIRDELHAARKALEAGAQPSRQHRPGGRT